MKVFLVDKNIMFKLFYGNRFNITVNLLINGHFALQERLNWTACLELFFGS